MVAGFQPAYVKVLGFDFRLGAAPAQSQSVIRVLLRAMSLHFKWTPHPVLVTIRENRDYIRVLLFSYYTTITGWGVLLNYIVDALQLLLSRGGTQFMSALVVWLGPMQSGLNPKPLKPKSSTLDSQTSTLKPEMGCQSQKIPNKYTQTYFWVWGLGLQVFRASGLRNLRKMSCEGRLGTFQMQGSPSYTKCTYFKNRLQKIDSLILKALIWETLWPANLSAERGVNLLA